MPRDHERHLLFYLPRKILRGVESRGRAVPSGHERLSGLASRKNNCFAIIHGTAQSHFAKLMTLLGGVDGNRTHVQNYSSKTIYKLSLFGIFHLKSNKKAKTFQLIS